MKLESSELVLSSEGRLYHINLKPEDIADTVILVGDPDRVALVSKHFDNIDFKTRHREFVTCTGNYRNKRFTVISTGIGTDNIDIVLTELDAAVNINLQKRRPLPTHRALNIIRLGTCGALQADVPVDRLVVSTHAVGMDGLLNFYDGFKAVNEDALSQAFIDQTNWPSRLPYPYCVKASDSLLKLFDGIATPGITATAPGFYGPQGRTVRLAPAMADINERLATFEFDGHRIVNFEMETSALYGMAAMLGHNHLTVCNVIANRVTKEFSKDMGKSIDDMIKTALRRLSANTHGS